MLIVGSITGFYTFKLVKTGKQHFHNMQYKDNPREDFLTLKLSRLEGCRALKIGEFSHHKR
jgi:hypothetical protein